MNHVVLNIFTTIKLAKCKQIHVALLINTFVSKQKLCYLKLFIFCNAWKAKCWVFLIFPSVLHLDLYVFKFSILQHFWKYHRILNNSNFQNFTWRTNTLQRFLGRTCVNLRTNRSTLTEPGFSNGETEWGKASLGFNLT